MFEPYTRAAKLIHHLQNGREMAWQSRPVVLRLEQASASSGGLVKLHSGRSQSGSGPRICVSDTFPGDTGAAGP